MHFPEQGILENICVCVLSKKLASKTIDLLRSFICTSDNGNSLWCSELGTSRKSHTTESVWNSGLGVRVAINLSTCVDIAKANLNFLLFSVATSFKVFSSFFVANPINTKNYNFRYWLICPWCPCFFLGRQLLACVCFLVLLLNEKYSIKSHSMIKM